MSRSALQPEHPPKVTDLLIRQKCEAMIEYGYVALRQFPKFERHVLAAEVRASMWALLRLIVVCNKRQHKKTTLLASVDVSEQAPFAAMERLGLQMVRGVLP
jgi:hypothetical protein